MEDLVRIISLKKYLNGNKPGTGKTPVAVVNIYARWSLNKRRTVFVMPLGLIKKNFREIERFSNFTADEIGIVGGSPARVAKTLANRDFKVLLMGPDRFKLCYQQIPKDFDAIDVDEFHLCFGGAESKRTQAFHAYASKCKEMHLMSGTFVNGRLDTTWPAIHAVEPRYYPLGYVQFLRRHAVLDDYDRPIYWREHEHLQKLLMKHGGSRSFASIFGENAPVFQIELCEISPRQKKIYDQFERLAMAELDRFMIDGTEPGVGAMRVQQILNHPRHFPNLNDLDPKTKAPRSFVDIVDGELTGKEQSLLIHVDDHIREGTSFFAFANLQAHQREMARIINEAGLPCGHMGAHNAAQRTKIDEEFVSGKLRSVVTSPPIGSTGFNWQFTGPKKTEVPHCIFAGVPWLDGDFVQAYSRGIRQKRQAPLRVTVQWYGTPVEERAFEILERKSRDANKVDPDRPILKFDR